MHSPGEVQLKVLLFTHQVCHSVELPSTSADTSSVGVYPRLRQGSSTSQPRCVSWKGPLTSLHAIMHSRLCCTLLGLESEMKEKPVSLPTQMTVPNEGPRQRFKGFQYWWWNLMCVSLHLLNPITKEAVQRVLTANATFGDPVKYCHW